MLYKSTPQRSVHICTCKHFQSLRYSPYLPLKSRHSHSVTTTQHRQQPRQTTPTASISAALRSSDRSRPSDTVVTCPHPIPERDFVTVCIVRKLFNPPPLLYRSLPQLTTTLQGAAYSFKSVDTYVSKRVHRTRSLHLSGARWTLDQNNPNQTKKN